MAAPIRLLCAHGCGSTNVGGFRSGGMDNCDVNKCPCNNGNAHKMVESSQPQAIIYGDDEESWGLLHGQQVLSEEDIQKGYEIVEKEWELNVQDLLRSRSPKSQDAGLAENKNDEIAMAVVQSPQEQAGDQTSTNYFKTAKDRIRELGTQYRTFHFVLMGFMILFAILFTGFYLYFCKDSSLIYHLLTYYIVYVGLFIGTCFFVHPKYAYFIDEQKLQHKIRAKELEKRERHFNIIIYNFNQCILSIMKTRKRYFIKRSLVGLVLSLAINIIYAHYWVTEISGVKAWSPEHLCVIYMVITYIFVDCALIYYVVLFKLYIERLCGVFIWCIFHNKRREYIFNGTGYESACLSTEEKTYYDRKYGISMELQLPVLVEEEFGKSSSFTRVVNQMVIIKRFLLYLIVSSFLNGVYGIVMLAFFGGHSDVVRELFILIVFRGIALGAAGSMAAYSILRNFFKINQVFSDSTAPSSFVKGDLKRYIDWIGLYFPFYGFNVPIKTAVIGLATLAITQFGTMIVSNMMRWAKE